MGANLAFNALAGYALTQRFRGKRAVISLQTRSDNNDVSRFGEETFLVLMISLLCWLGGRRIPIDRADFRHEGRAAGVHDRRILSPGNGPPLARYTPAEIRTTPP